MVQEELLWFSPELKSFDGYRRVSKTKVVRDVLAPPGPLDRASFSLNPVKHGNFPDSCIGGIAMIP